MDFIPADIQRYTELHSSPESDLLKKISRETHLNVLMPRMLSGHLQGAVLKTFCQMIGPSRVLEIGTYTGYGTISMMEGMPDKGTIHTIDRNGELKNRVQGYFEESGFGERIHYTIGEALEVIPTIQEKWDLVFIDADKYNYPNYYELVLDSLNPGGFIVADNVFWSGKVIDYNHQDEDTLALRRFNTLVTDDPRVENVLFPIRDGLMVIRKR